MVFLQQFQIHAGFSVKTAGEAFRNQHAQILVTLPVLTQQNQMIGIIVNAMDPVFHSSAGQINLAANDGLDSRSLGSLIKINTAIHHTVICDRDGSLSQFLDPIHHSANAAGTVKEGVFCMDMQMHEAHWPASFAS